MENVMRLGYPRLP